MKLSKKILLLYPILIFLIAILPLNNKEAAINHTYLLSFRLDHIIHALLFFPWMALPVLFSAKKIISKGMFSTLPWFFWGLLLALCSEGVQYFLSYRSFTLPDLLSNLFGLLLGWFCMPIIQRIGKWNTM
jgi:VanZ family protein